MQLWKWKQMSVHLPMAPCGHLGSCGSATSTSGGSRLSFPLPQCSHLPVCRGEDPDFAWARRERQNPRTPSGPACPSAVCVSLLCTSHKLQSAGRSSRATFSQGLPAVKQCLVTELRSLEVVRGERSPAVGGIRRGDGRLFSLIPLMPCTGSPIHGQFWLLPQMILPKATW